MNEQQELITRWEMFLSNIKQRFYDCLEMGQKTVLDSLIDNDYDYYSSFRVLSSIKTQIEDSIIHKIDETWYKQVRHLIASDYQADEMFKGYTLREQLQKELQKWYFICEGLLSEKYYKYAIQLVDKNFKCSQCSSSIQIKKDLFQSQYVTCPYCNTINTFVPETKYVQIGWNVVNNISAYYAIDEWSKMTELQHKNDIKNHEEYIHQYNESCIKYLKKYFEKRIELMPHTKETYEKDFKKALNEMIKQ